MESLKENIIESYSSELAETNRPGYLLTMFLFDLHSQIFKKEVHTKFILIISRLVRIYGRYTVLYAVCETALLEDLDFETPTKITRILSYVCIRRTERTEASLDMDLRGTIKKPRKNKRKLQIKNPYEGET